MEKTKDVLKAKTHSIEELGFGNEKFLMLHNDNITPMEYVVIVLLKIFEKNMDEAMNIMLEAHQKGRSVISNCTDDVGRSLMDQLKEMNEQSGFNLVVTMEE